ncbi:hypothetical protein HOU02_gp392 [Caulobacter phage CcrBL9]|uniref:Uncharacterized protein n=1 Tax=Caulobacter phage CcrBL9 TaxID=2283270 RepID=A0A385EC25_9CAUD|nr:hypothetical protein HOU02_gp392 [Caulobacter phage CcrBL9]AXQ69333.1 hypothetical protein CcrBL9_gp309 [Caulobacter phage CcrBL9]
MTRIPPPLNGEKTHPLSAVALSTLRSISRFPCPTQEINHGLINRYQREGLIELYEDVSPYKTHKGKKISFVRISPAGQAILQETG